MAKLSGGGITSNKVVSKREATREKPQVRAASPAGVDQQGQKVADAVKFGNELATNVSGGGPGKGRTTMPSGSQGRH
jgi:hypothetical protein